MAEGDITFYNRAKKELLDGNIDLVTDTIKVALLASHTPNIDTHEFFDDVSADEVSGTGYTAGGATLGTKATTADNTNDRASFDCADITWSLLDVGTPSHAVVYRDTGTAGTSQLICYIELGRASNGSDYTLVVNAAGLLRLT